jgi:protocatechuate 3,4-dioxygenase beta subunit
MPLDTDNDLLIVNDSITPAVGQVTHLAGRVLGRAGEPVRNAVLEIWQCDQFASYIHSRGHGGEQDANFQGYGRFLTASDGLYYFRTIKPVPYTLQGMSRAPHIHVAVSRNGRRILTTQVMVKGYKDNFRDMVLNGLRDPRDRETVLVDFKPMPDSRISELAATFDIVLGATAPESADGRLIGGIGKSEGRFSGPPRRDDDHRWPSPPGEDK